MSKKTTKKTVRRRDRRFLPQSANAPMLVKAFGVLGAATMGAGAWGYFYGESFASDEKLRAVPAYLVAAGSVLTGVAIWLGTSSEPPIRVGAPGIGVERGEVRRIPWWAVASITWKSGASALVVDGKDEDGNAFTLEVPVRSHPEAAAAILAEAEKRIPKVVDVSDDARSEIPRNTPSAGLVVELEPLQLVGRKDAITGKTISYEPDARVCDRCERVYAKDSVPKTCACGADLSKLGGKGGVEEEAEAEST